MHNKLDLVYLSRSMRRAASVVAIFAAGPAWNEGACQEHTVGQVQLAAYLRRGDDDCARECKVLPNADLCITCVDPMPDEGSHPG